jgi:FkbM family methyltransferase
MRKIFNRLGLVRGYLSGVRDFPVSAGDVLKGIAKLPCTRRGPAFVETVADLPEYRVVKVRGVGTPLYWPRALPLYDLYKVVTECFCEDDWHFYEVPQTKVLPGDVVLDCGAAEGIFSLRVLARAGRIIAFEPLPLFVSSLKKTFARQAKVTVVPRALASTPGEGFLSGQSLYATLSRRGEGSMPIRITTIDDYVGQAGIRVDFIKADVESFEFEMLKGAEDTIRRYKPKIAVTTYHPGNDWRQICQFLHSLVPEYSYRIKGISYNARQARPVMIHLWVDSPSY